MIQSPKATLSSQSADRALRAKSLLLGRGVQRDDSDDELGAEDFDWEWIYGEKDSNSETIQGAKHGSGFQCMLGDCVLLKAEGERQAWVGILCDFLLDEENGDKMANIMWFSTEKEIRNKANKRDDSLPNEVYITPAWDINPLDSINGSAKILSHKAFVSMYPDGRVPKHDVAKTFICRRACNTRTVSYSEEFTWEELFQGKDRVETLTNFVKTHTREKRKRKNVTTDQEWTLRNQETAVPSTPHKRHKSIESPAKRGKGSRKPTSKPVTPSSKRVVVKKPLEFTPLGTRMLSPSHTNASPFQLARGRLHVSAVPTALPCREESFGTVHAHLEAAISEGLGSCIYISGTPGTGKTATVREVVAQLHMSVQAEELDDFIFVEINGMKVTDPHQAYSLLWEALRGERVSPSHALELLEREFSQPSPRRVPCVVLMDELDQLVTRNQSVMYNFFNWPGLRHSRLIVLAVANTMDLPERTLSNKISSRLGLTRITFPGYTHDQLMTIIQSRLQGVPGSIVDPDAIQFASRKVAAVSGDARRALDICRRAVEIAEDEISDEPQVDTPSRKATSSTQTASTKSGRVVIATIKQAISEATSSPLQQYLKSLPVASKLFLSALMSKVRRGGVSECLFGDVVDEAKTLGDWIEEAWTSSILCKPGPMRLDGSQISDKASRVMALGSAAVELADAGLIGLEMRKAERTAKVRLVVNEDELRLAFKEDDDARNLAF